MPIKINKNTYLRLKKDPELETARQLSILEKQIEELKNIEDRMFSDPKLLSRLFQTFVSEFGKLKKGEDGFTPIKGVDYYTEDEKEQLIEYVQSQIRIPEDGADGADADEKKIEENILKRIKIPTPKDGKTPIAGVDYPTHDQMKSVIYTEIAALFALKPSKKGGKVITKNEVEQLIGKIQTKLDYAEVARGIESLATKEKLDYETGLKNQPDFLTEAKVQNMMRGGGDRVRVSELTGTGATRTFTVPAHKRALLVIGTDFPILYKSTVDFTTSGTTLTLDNGVPIPSSGASLAFLYVE